TSDTWAHPLVARFRGIQDVSPSWTCGKNYMPASLLCQDFFVCFVACLPKASMNTKKPKTRILNRLIVRSRRIDAVDKFKAFGVPELKRAIIAGIPPSTKPMPPPVKG